MYERSQKIIGKKVGLLTVTEYAFTKKNRSYWKCRCTCGKEIIASISNLQSGLIRSCGCLRTLKFEAGISGLKKLYSDYKTAAKKESREFTLTLEQFKKITSEKCSYCGTEPCAISASEHTKKAEVVKHTAYKYNGIDRIDSSKGYIEGNVTPCCRWCNIIKRERTVEEFKQHINRIYSFLIKSQAS